MKRPGTRRGGAGNSGLNWKRAEPRAEGVHVAEGLAASLGVVFSTCFSLGESGPWQSGIEQK